MDRRLLITAISTLWVTLIVVTFFVSGWWVSSWAAPEGASGYWFGAFILLGMICGTPFIVYNRARKRW